MVYSGCFYLMSFIDNIPKVGPMAVHLDEPHVTVMPQFVIPDENIIDFEDELKRMTRMRWFRPFHISPKEEEQFTSRDGEQVTVRKVQDYDGELDRYHYSTLQMVEQFQGTVASPWIRENFSPHVTGWVNPQKVTLHTLSLIHHKNGFGEDVVNRCNIRL